MTVNFDFIDRGALIGRYKSMVTIMIGIRSIEWSAMCHGR